MTYRDRFFLLDFLGDLFTSEYSSLHDSDVFFLDFFGDFFRELLFMSSAVNPVHQTFSVLFFFIYTDHEALDDLFSMLL